MDMVKLKIDGQLIQAPKGTTILEAALSNGIHIPSLCYLKDISDGGVCRICVCEAEGSKKFLPACTTSISEGMCVYTDTPAVRESRRLNLELIMANHNGDCTECERGGDCELQMLCKEYGVNRKRFGAYSETHQVDQSDAYIVRNNDRCVQCRRCVSVCKNAENVGAIGVFGRGSGTRIGIDVPLRETNCIHCGMCVACCPVGALTVKDDTFSVWKAIADKRRKVAAVVAPGVEVEIGECFGEPAGSNCAGKLVSMLRLIGFDRVYCAGAAAARTVSEELSALETAKKAGELPLIGCTCPAALEYINQYYPELSKNISRGKSTQMNACGMCREELCGDEVFVVSLTTCLAEKTAVRKNPYADAVLTVPEIAAMIKRAGVSTYTAAQVWDGLDETEYDHFKNEASVWAISKTGGIGPLLDESGGLYVTGLKTADAYLKQIKEGALKPSYLEILACPGGCLNGGGQSHQTGSAHSLTDLAESRSKGLKNCFELRNTEEM